jgi:hypothetical protein
MKYIKRFNEELNQNIYRKKASILSDLGHKTRARNLVKHSNVIGQLNILNNVIKETKKYLPYGVYDAGRGDGSKLKEQFALMAWFDNNSFVESLNDYENKYNDTFWLSIDLGLIPIIDDDDEKDIRSYYSEVSRNDDDNIYIKKLKESDTSIGRVCDYLDCDFWGSFSGSTFYINFKIVDDKINIVGMQIEAATDDQLDILGRKSGKQLKNLLVKLFSNEKFDFPAYNDKNLQNEIKNLICVETGFSEKYKFAFSEVGEFIKKQGINKFYHSFDFVN